MLIINATYLITAVALPNGHMSAYQSLRGSSLILIISAIVAMNSLNLSAMEEGIGLYNNLIQVSTVTTTLDILIIISGACVIIPQSEKNKTKQIYLPIAEYGVLGLFTSCGSTLLLSSNDLMIVYISIELQSFAVYVIATLERESEDATNAGLKYLILGGLSSALIILGIGVIYSNYSTTNWDNLESLISVNENIENNNTYDNYVQGVGFSLIVSGFLFKISASPFHQWSPDVYEGVSTYVTSWLAVVPKISVLALILEITIRLGSSYTNLLLISSFLSLIIGTVVGLAQITIKRLLAYSTISHIGWLLLSLVVNTESSYEAYLFYLGQYTITSVLSFIIILAFGNIHQRDIFIFNDFKGQGIIQPLLSLSFAICLFSIAGVPPFIGFFAKQTTLYAAIQMGYLFITIIGVVSSIIAASYYLRIVRTLFFETNSDNSEFNNEIIITSVHSFIISFITLSLSFYIINPSIILNSVQLLALNIYNILWD